ncbi:MAG: hypothetical protein WC666_03860 [Candidatus Paceibacterota bacterium]|jgi:hypothetical protein
MAKNDIKIKDSYMTVPVVKWQTEAAATAILAGEPVKLKAAGSPYVIPLADNEPAIGTTTQLVGIAASDSTQTASADGSVMVYMPIPGVVYACKATTTSNIDTQAKLDALCGDNVLFDFGSSTYTVDENAGNAGVNGIQIVGGDYAKGVVYFTIRTSATSGVIA